MDLIIERGSGANLEYHLPFTQENVNEIRKYAGNIISITADGKEFLYVISNFFDIPRVKAEKCTWRLPWCWFIAENFTLDPTFDQRYDLWVKREFKEDIF